MVLVLRKYTLYLSSSQQTHEGRSCPSGVAISCVTLNTRKGRNLFFFPKDMKLSEAKLKTKLITDY